MHYISVKFDVDGSGINVDKVFWEALNIMPWLDKDEIEKISMQCFELYQEGDVDHYVDEKKLEEV